MTTATTEKLMYEYQGSGVMTIPQPSEASSEYDHQSSARSQSPLAVYPPRNEPGYASSAHRPSSATTVLTSIGPAANGSLKASTQIRSQPIQHATSQNESLADWESSLNYSVVQPLPDDGWLHQSPRSGYKPRVL
ncbi:hypothetical protein BX666DRAFT_1909047 [Dichotomocladium elegans]|nr:hypothetical protein BX666DRAFT_1909047 [Dichotomocladium elegans]